MAYGVVPIYIVNYPWAIARLVQRMGVLYKICPGPPMHSSSFVATSTWANSPWRESVNKKARLERLLPPNKPPSTGRRGLSGSLCCLSFSCFARAAWLACRFCSGVEAKGGKDQQAPDACPMPASKSVSQSVTTEVGSLLTN